VIERRSGGYSREAARRVGDNAATAMKSVVVDSGAYDWEGDSPLHRPSAHTIIYEMHVRGFTRCPSSGVGEARRGTYAGLVDKIPYLQELGVTAVELLPVFAFDAQDCPPGKVNYWGYAPVSFFAPHPVYSSRQDPLGPVDEFRDMVKSLHRAGIEVILDVVFNHTAEGDHTGPTLGFRGIDNPTYYILEDGGAVRYLAPGPVQTTPGFARGPIHFGPYTDGMHRAAYIPNGALCVINVNFAQTVFDSHLTVSRGPNKPAFPATTASGFSWSFWPHYDGPTNLIRVDDKSYVYKLEFIR
jgi:hypothetical protein